MVAGPLNGNSRSSHVRGLAAESTSHQHPSAARGSSDAGDRLVSGPPFGEPAARFDRNRQVSIALTCATLITRTATTFPEQWAVDWDDEPSRFTLYADPPPRLRLDAPISFELGINGADCSATSGEAPTAPRLSGLLAYAAGLLQQRQEVRFTTHPGAPPPRAGSAPAVRHVECPPSAVGCFRAVPSGGALYPWELYVCGTGDPEIADGAYHYDPAHHALAILRPGDAGPQLEALLPASAPPPSHGLVIFISTVFWKNGFKYGHSSVRLHAIDAGILAGQLIDLAPAFGFDARACFHFQDRRVGELFALSEMLEAVQVVVTLERHTSGLAQAPRAPATALGAEQIPEPRIVLQRSRRPKPCPTAVELNRWSALESLPAPHELESDEPFVPDDQRARHVHVLPPVATGPHARRLAGGLLRWRRSGIDPYELASVDDATLAAICADAVAGYANDLPRQAHVVQHVALRCVINRVGGLRPGVYRYEADRHALSCLEEGEHDVALQASYHLKNVNLAAAAAVVYLVGSYRRCVHVYGNRGFRLLNLEVGIMARRAQTSGTALGCGMQIILGFSAEAASQMLRLDGSELSPLLGIAIGRPPQHHASITLPLWV